MKKLFVKFFKFGVVGTLGTAIDFGVTALLMAIFALSAYYDMSFEDIISGGGSGVVYGVLTINTIGFVVAATFNYYLNRVWTWRSSNPNVKSEYSTFLLVSVIGLIINLGAIYLFNRYGNWSFNFNEFSNYDFMVEKFWVSKALATLVVMFWNFFANNAITFKKV